MSEPARLIGVFFEPGKTFAEIAERPRWIVPLLIGILLAIGYIYAFNTHIGWEAYLHRTMDNNPQMQRLAPDQRDRIFEQNLKITPTITLVAVVVFAPLVILLWGGIALGIVKGLLGVPIRFKQVFAAFCYAGLPRAIYSILSTVVIFVTKEPENFDLQNGFYSNPGAFMDSQTTPKFVYTLASSLDLFVVWTIVLAAIGLKAAGGKRLSFGGALFGVALPVVVGVLIRGALAAAGFSQ